MGSDTVSANGRRVGELRTANAIEAYCLEEVVENGCGEKSIVFGGESQMSKQRSQKLCEVSFPSCDKLVVLRLTYYQKRCPLLSMLCAVRRYII